MVVAFFYLLWVGEYTTLASKQEKRTIPLQKCDVRMWKDGKLLDHGLGRDALLEANSATISIANTKNGTKGAVVHHDAIGGVIPVAPLARRIANLQGMKATCWLSMVCHTSDASHVYQTSVSPWRYGGVQPSTAFWRRDTPSTTCHLTAFGPGVQLQ